MSKEPLLLALQLCPIDAEAAWSLLRLIADMCPGPKYAGVDLLVSVRKDTPFRIQDIQYAGKKFNRVWTYRCDRMAAGWPAGCNSVATQTYQWFIRNNRSGHWNYSGIFLIEADGLPMSRDWLDLIVDEWNGCEKHILGYHDKSSNAEEHINGNCIIGKAMADIDTTFPGGPADMAWDYFWRHLMVRNGKASKFIFNDYRLGTLDNPLVSDDHLFAPRKALSRPGEVLFPAYLHGLKDTRRGHRLLRERLLD